MQFDPQKKLEMLQRINKYKNEALFSHYVYNCFGEGVDDEDFKQIFKYM